MAPKVLMVEEKPSIVLSIASVLSLGRSGVNMLLQLAKFFSESGKHVRITVIKEAVRCPSPFLSVPCSYGPCQTPTLGFCVQRYLQITTFKPEKFWALHPYIIQNGYELKLEWERNKLFDSDVAGMFQKLVMEDVIVEVTGISEKTRVQNSFFWS